MVKVKTKFLCTDCGYESPKWYGKCPGCSAWNSMVEETEKVVKTQGVSTGIFHTKEKPLSIINIESDKEPRIKTGIEELNRVLGGGVVPGSLVLVGEIPALGNLHSYCRLRTKWPILDLKYSIYLEKSPCDKLNYVRRD